MPVAQLFWLYGMTALGAGAGICAGIGVHRLRDGLAGRNRKARKMSQRYVLATVFMGASVGMGAGLYLHEVTTPKPAQVDAPHMILHNLPVSRLA